jgi:hypothetical protein
MGFLGAGLALLDADCGVELDGIQRGNDLVSSLGLEPRTHALKGILDDSALNRM